MSSKIKVIVRIKTNHPKIFYRSTQPENKFAPKIIRIEHEIVNKELVFKVSSDSLNEKNIWTIRNTVDDYIFSIKLVDRVLRLWGIKI